jgi:hypothetical protein
MIMDPREPGPKHLSCAYSLRLNFTGKLKVRRGEPPSASLHCQGGGMALSQQWLHWQY